jgi:hypothetical protein
LSGGKTRLRRERLKVDDGGVVVADAGADVAHNATNASRSQLVLKEHPARMGRSLRSQCWSLMAQLNNLPQVSWLLVRMRCRRRASSAGIVRAVMIAIGETAADGIGAEAGVCPVDSLRACHSMAWKIRRKM